MYLVDENQYKALEKVAALAKCLPCKIMVSSDGVGIQLYQAIEDLTKTGYKPGNGDHQI